MSRAPWIDEVSARSVAEVADALGLERLRGETWACPACLAGARGSGDKRGAVGRSRSGRGWACHRCGARGDALDLAATAAFGVRLAELDREQRRELRLRLAAMGLCSGRTSWQQAPVRAQRPIEARPAEDHGPDAGEVQALWDACGSALMDAGVAAYSSTRGWGRGLEVLQQHDEMRVTPAPEWDGWPDWWPPGRARCWRMVTRVWSPSGVLLGLHGRAVGQPPIVRGKALPKALGHRMRGAGWMMSRSARDGLSSGLTQALVCEGVADFWALSAVQPLAVLGGVSGSFRTLGALPWAPGAEIVLLTHGDDAGDLYARQAIESMTGRKVALRRGRLGGVT